MLLVCVFFRIDKYYLFASYLLIHVFVYSDSYCFVFYVLLFFVVSQ